MTTPTFLQPKTVLSAIAVALILSACAPPPTVEFTEADEAAITASEDAFEASANARDWAGVAAQYAEDALFIPPNQPAITGRAGVETWHEGTPPGAELDLKVVDIVGAGELAYVHGTYELIIPAGEDTLRDTGHYLEIRRKQQDGSWPITLDIFNSDLAAPEPIE
ncbi:MAG: DUF4440 domain-containing protein [Rhodothermales bacterium]|nr:DUF4440 domain-containing protein [Rhodothermales bacterium]